MKIEESLQIVNMLHSAYPQDRKATREDLLARAEAYSVALADYDIETVRRAAQHCIATNKWHPTTAELINEVKRAYLATPGASVTPITTAEPIEDEALDEYLDAFCQWIGFGGEENDDIELPKGVLRYEE